MFYIYKTLINSNRIKLNVTCGFVGVLRHRLISKDNNNGLSLIEVILSMALLACVFVPLIGVFSASFLNSGASADIIDNKYLAETYMEVVKASDIADLLKDDAKNPLLTPQFGFKRLTSDELLAKGLEQNVVVFEKDLPEGVLIEIVETGTIVSGEAVFNTDDYTELKLYDVAPEADYPDSLNVDYYNLTAEELPDNEGFVRISDKIGRVLDIETDGASTICIKLMYSKGTNDKTQKIDITNTTRYRFEFYCVNSFKDDGSEIYHDYPIPIFDVFEGIVAVYDATMPANKLASETNDVFNKGKELNLAYSVKVTISNDKGSYVLESLKTIR